MVIDVKFLIYFLICALGFGISYFIHFNGGNLSPMGIITGFWTGYFGYMVLSWGDKE